MNLGDEACDGMKTFNETFVLVLQILLQSDFGKNRMTWTPYGSTSKVPQLYSTVKKIKQMRDVDLFLFSGKGLGQNNQPYIVSHCNLSLPMMIIKQ